MDTVFTLPTLTWKVSNGTSNAFDELAHRRQPLPRHQHTVSQDTVHEGHKSREKPFSNASKARQEQLQNKYAAAAEDVDTSEDDGTQASEEEEVSEKEDEEIQEDTSEAHRRNRSLPMDRAPRSDLQLRHKDLEYLEWAQNTTQRRLDRAKRTHSNTNTFTMPTSQALSK
jgi:hypothetical protein